MINLEIFKIDDKIDENEKINRSHLIVKRDRREDAKIDFDRKIISDQNIEFFDVVDIVACKIIDEVNEEINETMNENIAIDVNVAKDTYSLLKIFFDFFACFFRT